MDDLHDEIGQHDLAFMEFHARNTAEALALRGRQALIVGCGAVGSNVAALLARSGMDVAILDRDVLETENLHRHIASRRFVGEPKALATAKTLRAELPSAQTIRGIHGDAELLTDEELDTLVRVASVVIGATGSDALDRRLNAACRIADVPLVVPGMWPQGGSALGEVLVVPWSRHQPDDRAGACFACVSPDTRTAAAARPLEAQAGESAEVIEAASMTAQLAIGLLLRDTERGRWIAGQLRRGRNYFLIRRFPTQLVAVATTPRPGCHGCGAQDMGRGNEQRHVDAAARPASPPGRLLLPARLMERFSLPTRLGLAAVAGILLPIALIHFGLEGRAPAAVVGGAILAAISVFAAVRTRFWLRTREASTTAQWTAAGVLAVGFVTVAAVAAILVIILCLIILIDILFGPKRD